MSTRICHCGEGPCCAGCGATKVKARGLCSRCYEFARRDEMQHGTWETSFVSSDRVLEHLDALERADISRGTVIRYTGLHHQTVDGIKPGGRVRSETASRILAVQPNDPEVLAARVPAMLSAVGVTRRLQALCAIGWPVSVQAERAGMRTVVNHVRAIARGEIQQVTQNTHDALCDLYDKLSGTPGPDAQTRERAQKAGWAPPLAWRVDDDDTGEWGGLQNFSDEPGDIDDPDAKPIGMKKQRPLSRPKTYREMLDLGYRNLEHIAYRMNVKPGALIRFSDIRDEQHVS